MTPRQTALPSLCGPKVRMPWGILRGVLGAPSVSHVADASSAHSSTRVTWQQMEKPSRALEAGADRPDPLDVRALGWTCLVLRNENSSTGEPAGAEVAERLVRVRERVLVNVDRQRDLSRQRQEVMCVLACEVGDRTNRSLFPQQSIWKRWYVAHMDAGADHGAGGPDARNAIWCGAPKALRLHFGYL